VILVVSDDDRLVRLLRILLGAEGYEVVHAATTADALVQAATRAPAVLVLDHERDGPDTLAVCRRVRQWSRVPILVLSAGDREADRLRAFEVGADDCISKPFGPRELVARVRVALRHAAACGVETDKPIFRIDDLVVDLAAHRVERAGVGIHLTPIQFEVLALLVRHAGRIVTHTQILREVWGPAFVDRSHYVRVFMAGLRRKLGDTATHPRYIFTEGGVGYRMHDVASPEGQ
jgi:two-component system KDP operon response regulator KdpE